MLKDLREYIDQLQIEGHTIGDDHDDDPIPIDPYGKAVDTWRENYPYDERMDRHEYDELKYGLQVELLKFQTWAFETQTRHVLIFEGRDAAGKGHDQAVHGAPQPEVRAHRRADQAQRPRAEPVVLPALRAAPARRRGDGPLRPVLVQPRRGRAGDGAHHRAGVRAVHDADPLFERMIVDSGIS